MRIPRNPKQCDLTNHLGNVLSTVLDRKTPITATGGSGGSTTITHYEGDVVFATDYYPFGSPMSWSTPDSSGGRMYSGAGYRFGLNGIEKLNEVAGVGNHYTALFGEYDPRLGRRWNQDPKPNPSISNYAIFNNNPNWFKDPLLDSSVWDNKGYMIHYDKNDKDLRAFMKDGDNLTLLGNLGGKIDASGWFPNLLKENSEESDDTWDPRTFRDNVKQYGKWDYKYASPANPNKNARQHLLGIAFYRKDKTKGSGDLGETMFNFDGSSGRAEDLNNLHFGVVGKAYGLFSETFMLKKAGAEEMGKWAKEGKQVPAAWRPMIKVMTKHMGEVMVQEQRLGAPYGDNPTDHEWIKKGFQYYNTHSKDLDEE